jgi:hypothetical protein
MSERWYRAWDTFSEIRPVTVEKFTDNTVWIAGRRHARKTDGVAYYPNWEDAHAFLVRKAEAELQYARVALQRAQGKHGNVVGMKRAAESTAE